MYYCLIFLLIFNIFFVQTFSDGGQTTGMFVLTSFLFSVAVTLAFALVKRMAWKTGAFDSAFANFFLLYALSELIISFFQGEICFFGINYRLHLVHTIDKGIRAFREQRDIAFSTSFIIAAVVGLVFTVSTTRRKTAVIKY